jgi:hypothetical protein
MINKLERYEMAQNKAVENGTVFEEEMIEITNGRHYKEEAYAKLYPEKCKLDNLENDQRFEKILQIREEAQAEFRDTMDFNKKRISVDQAMNLVEKCQTGNPENPSKLFANKLYQAVKNRFVSDKYILKFFSAAGGTHLDVSHGIDCYFKLYDKNTGKELTRATIDLTQHPKNDWTKSDVLLYIAKEDSEKLDNSRGNKNFDAKFLDEIVEKEAEKITNAMIENFKQKN